MTLTVDKQTGIIRTDRGLTISGTRITLYDVMDHLAAGWTPRLIRNWLPLSDEQIDQAIEYIEMNRAEVEAEYQTVLQEAKQLRDYWDDRNHDRLAEIAQMPPKPGQEALYAKLKAWKAELGLTA